MDLWFASPSNFRAHLQYNEFEQLRAMSEMRSFGKHEDIFHAGEFGHSVYLLLYGRTKIFEIGPCGREVILWFSLPGELFGLADVPRGDRRTVHAQACVASKVLVIPRHQFFEFLGNNPRASAAVIELLSSRLRTLSDMLLNVATEDVTTRVAKLILRLSTRHGKKVGDTIYLDIPLSHQEMADMIGASRQTVSTVLGVLRAQGLLQVQRRRLVIRSNEELEELAHEA